MKNTPQLPPYFPTQPYNYIGSQQPTKQGDIDYLQVLNADIYKTVGEVKGQVSVLREELAVFREETKDNFTEVKNIINDVLTELEKNKMLVIKSVFLVVLASMYGKNLIEVIFNVIFK